MERFFIAENINFDPKRCYECGIFWAVETRATISDCPVCAGRNIKKAHAAEASAIRSNAALKGIISRTKKV